MPLYYKILIANAAIVALVILGSGAIANSAAADEGLGLVVLLGAGLVVSIATNAVILRLALSPLAQLERTAHRVQEGDAGARVEASDLADRNLERLAATFNMMLDSAESYRTRLREITARALTAQEDERRRISRELHDGIAQTLAALRVSLRVARAAEEPERGAALDRVSTDLAVATEEIKRIALGLRPPALDMLGLAPAVESYARTMAEASGIQIATEIAATDGILTPDAELALYRILQEALSNIARHSGARTARVHVEVTPAEVRAEVSDTGRGFDLETEMAGGGLGLFGMQERGAYIGGHVDITSAPGNGTRVLVRIPATETRRHV